MFQKIFAIILFLACDVSLANNQPQTKVNEIGFIKIGSYSKYLNISNNSIHFLSVAYFKQHTHIGGMSMAGRTRTDWYWASTGYPISYLLR